MALDILSFRCYDISGIVTGILPGWAGAGFPALLRICAEFGAIPPNSALGRSDLAAAAFRGTASKGARPFPFVLFAFLALLLMLFVPDGNIAWQVCSSPRGGVILRFGSRVGRKIDAV